MKGKKALFLFLALLLPVAVFVFLKFFGKNEFDVPLIFESGVSSPPAQCNIHYPSPYVVPDSILIQAGVGHGTILIIDFSDRPSTEMQVVRDEFRQDAVVTESALSIHFADEKFVKECVLLIAEPNEIVMIDSQQHIRGYYQNTREDIDRLILEVKIVLKKY
jgi:hypothetical protein